jgi:hypothetical protein
VRRSTSALRCASRRSFTSNSCVSSMVNWSNLVESRAGGEGAAGGQGVYVRVKLGLMKCVCTCGARTEIVIWSWSWNCHVRWAQTVIGL